MTRIPNTPSWQERIKTKVPDSDYDFKELVSEYLEKFTYRQNLKLGPSYGKDFKEFHDWCEAHLGTKFKDWFIFPCGKEVYTLFCASDKWAIFLALTHVDLLA